MPPLSMRHAQPPVHQPRLAVLSPLKTPPSEHDSNTDAPFPRKPDIHGLIPVSLVSQPSPDLQQLPRVRKISSPATNARKREEGVPSAANPAEPPPPPSSFPGPPVLSVMRRPASHTTREIPPPA